jgi:hypothetical protein
LVGSQSWQGLLVFVDPGTTSVPSMEQDAAFLQTPLSQVSLAVHVAVAVQLDSLPSASQLICAAQRPIGAAPPSGAVWQGWG